MRRTQLITRDIIPGLSNQNGGGLTIGAFVALLLAMWSVSGAFAKINGSHKCYVRGTGKPIDLETLYDLDSFVIDIGSIDDQRNGSCH